MARNVELLLIDTVENLGIVGDIVRVKPGYARNYLHPMGLAVKPTKKKIDSLQEARNRALSELAALRQAREELLERMTEVTIEMTRSCNDQGVLYGSVSQRDIADSLQEAGFDVGTRSIRIPTAIRRVGDYQVPIQFDKDLRTEVTLNVLPDHPLDEVEEEEPEPDEEQRRRERDDRHGPPVVDAIEAEM
jgi:large subunit ribosomal protein L9